MTCLCGHDRSAHGKHFTRCHECDCLHLLTQTQLDVINELLASSPPIITHPSRAI